MPPFIYLVLALVKKLLTYLIFIVSLVLWSLLFYVINLNSVFQFSTFILFLHQHVTNFEYFVPRNQLFVYGIQEPGKIHIVLEYCKGGDLSMFIQRQQERIPEVTAKHFMLQLGISQSFHVTLPVVFSLPVGYEVILLILLLILCYIFT